MGNVTIFMTISVMKLVKNLSLLNIFNNMFRDSERIIRNTELDQDYNMSITIYFRYSVL